jgi:hypothetical protein
MAIFTIPLWSFHRKIGATERRSTKLAPIPGKSQVQHLNRIGRRIIMWMLLIAALAVIWNLLDERGRQLLSQCQVEAKSRWARYIALKKNLMVRVRLSPM